MEQCEHLLTLGIHCGSQLSDLSEQPSANALPSLSSSSTLSGLIAATTVFGFLALLFCICCVLLCAQFKTIILAYFATIFEHYPGKIPDMRLSFSAYSRGEEVTHVYIGKPTYRAELPFIRSGVQSTGSASPQPEDDEVTETQLCEVVVHRL